MNWMQWILNSLQYLPGKMIDAVRGKHTLLAFGFFVMGHVAFFLGKLSPIYIAFMSTLMSFVLGHSIKEDLMQAKGVTPGPPSPAPPGGSQ